MQVSESKHRILRPHEDASRLKVHHLPLSDPPSPYVVYAEADPGAVPRVSTFPKPQHPVLNSLTDRDQPGRTEFLSRAC